MPNDIKSEKAAIRVAVTLASFSFPAPSSCPTTIAIVVPIVTKIQLEIFPIVLQIFRPPTVARPLVDKACVCNVRPPAHKNSLSMRGVPVTIIFLTRDPGTLRVL